MRWFIGGGSIDHGGGAAGQAARRGTPGSTASATPRVSLARARPAAVLVVQLAALAALAGCSSLGGSRSATATTSSQDASAAVRAVVQCMRSNGMPNLPDPQIDANGQVKFPQGTPEPSESVLRACKSVIDRLPPSARGEREQNSADMPALLRFGRCMREHGVADFPDPRADGIFYLAGTNARREIYGTGRSKQPPSPRASAAMEACGLNGSLRGRIFLDVGN
jgi:hypothetical protein